jgi:hypothetical protein
LCIVVKILFATEGTESTEIKRHRGKNERKREKDKKQLLMNTNKSKEQIWNPSP